LRRERFVELGAWLSELEGHWTSQLEAFREHAERDREGRA